MNKKRFSNLKIIHKITLAYFVFIIIPIVSITSIVYVQLYEKEKTAVSENQKSILWLSEENLNKSIGTIESIGDTIAKDSRLTSFLAKGSIYSSYSSEEYLNSISSIFEYSRFIQKVNAHSARIYLHDLSIPESNNVFIHDSKIADQEWLNGFITSDYHAIWLDPYSVDHLYNETSNKRNRFSFCRKLFASNGRYVGLLVINIYQDELFSGFTQFYNANNFFYAINPYGEVLNSIEDNLSHLTPDQLDQIGSQTAYTYTDQAISYMWHYINDLNIYIAVGTYLDNPLLISQQMIIIFASLAFVLLAIILIFYYYLNRIFKKINDKVNHLNHIVLNDYNERIAVESSDEIGQISNSFNVLLDKIDLLIKDVVQKETAQKDANLRALQYQINPHFIYNTIEIFSTKMELAKEYEVSGAMTSFGKMLRYNLNSELTSSTIKDELNHVKSYVAIEKIKYGERLQLEFDCSESLYDISLIKFIIQPIVENSILHGFKKTISEMLITIHISKNNNQLDFSITDNGIGLEPKYVDLLNTVFKNSDYSHPQFKTSSDGGIGLKNINERLKLFYSTDCYLHITRDDSITSLNFSLPIIEA